jgi:hypothetical protein
MVISRYTAEVPRQDGRVTELDRVGDEPFPRSTFHAPGHLGDDESAGEAVAVRGDRERCVLQPFRGQVLPGEVTDVDGVLHRVRIVMKGVGDA